MNFNRSVQRIRWCWRCSAMVLWALALVGLWSIWQPPPSAKPVVDTAAKPIAVSSEKGEPQGKKEPAVVADFELIERSGRKVTRADLLGHPWVVCFVFTRCAGPCLAISGKMKLLHDRFRGTGIRFVTITVDPEYDTPERLRNYADVFDADPEHWLFLTGEERTIYDLISDSFQLSVEQMTGTARKPGFEVTHSTNILHVDAHGHVIGKYNAQNDSEVVALRKVLEKTTRNDKQKDRTRPAADRTGNTSATAPKTEGR